MIDQKILEWFIPSLKEAATIKGDVPGHEFHGNQYTEGGGGSSEEGGSDGGLSSGDVPSGGNNLSWKGEDTIAGDFVVETSHEDTSGITEDHAKNYIKEHLSDLIGGINGPEDVEDVKINRLEHGKGYVKIHVDVTPTEDAGANWAESTESTYDYARHH